MSMLRIFQVTDALRGRRMRITPDWNGGGRSRCVRPDAIHLPHAFIGGWSMGGWVAMKLTLDHPERVDRLVVYDSAGSIFPRISTRSCLFPRCSWNFRRLAMALSPDEHPHPRAIPGFIARAILRKFEEGGWVTRRSMMAMTSGRDLLDFRLQKIHQPTAGGVRRGGPSDSTCGGQAHSRRDFKSRRLM